MTTKKKEYEKPSMKVHELKQRAQLLVGSGTGQFDDYQDGGNPWDQ